MQPETVKPGSSDLPASVDPDSAELLLAKSDFDRMIKILQDPPKLPESLRQAAEWYNVKMA